MAGSVSSNISLWSAVAAWTLAQTIKMLARMLRREPFDFGVFLSTGGMPSAHTAFVCALSTSIGLCAGFDTPLWALSFAFASIVMFDAQSVRRAAGQQARVLNRMVQEVFKDHHFSHHKLAELLGHTRLEVFMGLLTGVMVALVMHAARTRWFMH